MRLRVKSPTSLRFAVGAASKPLALTVTEQVPAASLKSLKPASGNTTLYMVFFLTTLMVIHVRRKNSLSAGIGVPHFEEPLARMGRGARSGGLTQPPRSGLV